MNKIKLMRGQIEYPEAVEEKGFVEQLLVEQSREWCGAFPYTLV